MTYVILFIFGIVIGSFLNVVALRFDSKNFGGRSKCPHCSKTLRWFELVPIVSYILQLGKCRNCGVRISPQYPIVEILTGLIFVSAPVWMLPVFCIYVVILIYDFHHKIIPDPLVYLAILLSVVSRWLLVSSNFDWFAGPIIFLFFASIWLFSRGRAMGFGDAKLGLSIGLLLGASQGFSAIIFSFWIGAVVGLFLMMLKSLQ